MRRISKWTALLFMAFVSAGCKEKDATASLHLVLHAGDGQTALVRAQVPIAPTVVVLDAQGAPSPGAYVTFAVVDGGGFPSATSVLSGDDGKASISWALGDTAGPNHLSASIPGSTVTFTATATAPSLPLQLAISDGEAQTAGAGTQLPVAPTVLVRDASGAPVPGLSVAFSVVDGGGFASVPSALTGADGRAAVLWTLGSAAGLNHLSASVQGASVTFSAFGRGAPSEYISANVTVYSNDTVYSGAQVPVVGDRLRGNIDVSSTYTVSSMVLQVAGRSVDVTRGSYEVSLAGVPRSSLLLLLTVTDMRGHSAQFAKSVLLDRPPRLTVTIPLLARESASYEVTCTDDGPSGCSDLELDFGGLAARHGADARSGTIDLSPYEGQGILVTAWASDGIQHGYESVQIHVERSPALSPLATVPGTVVDVLGSRILYCVGSLSSGWGCNLNLYDASTSTTESLTGGDRAYISRAFVTPTGAIYTDGSNVFEWRDGASTLLQAGDLLDVVDGFALLQEPRRPAGGALYRRNLGTATTLTVAGDAVKAAIASNGDVAYTRGTGVGEVLRWHDGAAARLSQQADPAVVPSIDATHVVYQTSNGSVAFSDATTETVIPDSGNPGYEAEFAAAGGRVLFLRTLDGYQIWSLDGGSEHELLAVFRGIEASADDGTVILRGGSRRYASRSGQSLVDVGSLQGHVVERGGQFYFFVDGMVATITP